MNTSPMTPSIRAPITPSTASIALDIRNVSFHYGKKQVLGPVSVSIQSGETVILLGPNGAGKTTLFSLICGLFSADSGSIHINGQSLLNRAEALAPLGIVFQTQTLDLDLSVEQNLMYYCALHGIHRAEARSRITNSLKQLDLGKRRHDKVRTLNGGHRRRVEIARATLHEPSILLLDEPTVGLDIPTRNELIRTIHELPDTNGCAVLWATHLIDEIYTDDRVLMLHDGQLERDGTSCDLLENAQVSNFSELMQLIMHTDDV
ncbi:MAG: ABC-2 type transport system ATP-binding protein [Granulosicoccus sp.]|jgi:ABC-2 type transport system ATP-binding protein